MHYFNGFKIAIRQKQQEIFFIKRGWKERLFSLPWRPLVKERKYIDKQAIKRNRQILRVDDIFYVTQEMKQDLIKKLKEKQNDTLK